MRTDSVAADPITADRWHELIDQAVVVMDGVSLYRLNTIMTGPAFSLVRLAGEAPDPEVRA